MPAASNRLLLSLSPEVRASLYQKLQGVGLPVRTVLFTSGATPKYAYFLTSGIASVVANMDDGDEVEVGLLGREALAGSLHLLGPHEGSTRCFMQVTGSGFRIEFKQLAEEFDKNPKLHARVLRHVQWEALTSAQLSACNRLHNVEERLARWLLMVADQLESDELSLTQEFMGGCWEQAGPRLTSLRACCSAQA